MNGLVSVFADPPNSTTTLLELRTQLKIRMAGDRPQRHVVAALSEAQLATLDLLIAFGADLNAGSHHSGSTALHLAARSGATEAVKRLIMAGATVDSRNRHGFTPLILATIAGHADSCRALLDAGASSDAKDGLGNTARWYASTAGSAMTPQESWELFGVKHSPAASGPARSALHESSDKGGWGALDDDATLSTLPDICEVDRISHEQAPNAFEREYLLAARPVVVIGGAGEMQAKHSWGKGRFLKLVSNQTFQAQKLPVRQQEEPTSLEEYLQEAAQGMHAAPLSWNVPHNSTLWDELQRHLSLPRALSTASVGHLASFGLFLGPQGSGTSMHYHRSAWNALLYGRKLWALTPPPSSTFRRNEMAITSFKNGWLNEAALRASNQSIEAGKGERMLFCVQHEDDVLFVPAGWGHATLNLNESIGVASFFSDEEASGFKPTKLWHSARGMRSIQTAVGISTPSDYDPDGHE